MTWNVFNNGVKAERGYVTEAMVEAGPMMRLGAGGRLFGLLDACMRSQLILRLMSTSCLTTLPLFSNVKFPKPQ